MFGKLFASLISGKGKPVKPPAYSLQYQHGPGRVTLYTHHKKIGRSKYKPHQGKRECTRRRKQMGVS